MIYRCATVFTKQRKNKSKKYANLRAAHDRFVLNVMKCSNRSTPSSKWVYDALNYTTYDVAPVSNVIPSTANGTAKNPMVYSGNKLLGIAVLHKSCLVPVFSRKDAEDIAKMRR